MFSPYSYTYTHTNKKLCEDVNVLISLIVVIISQCLCVSHHHIKYIYIYKIFLFVNYISIKMGKNSLTFHEDVYRCYCFNIYYFFFSRVDVVSSEIEIQTCLAVLVLCLPRARLHEHWGMSWEKKIGWMGSWQRAFAVSMGKSAPWIWSPGAVL